ncbi:hypothetical protein HBH70_129350 [Parastagonospora nodorum]|nr:hypothetical protein HBH70_129350 [Parastagonospora nodorum]KAH5374235.1 hypothetical protein HBI49_053750 [Parastagonospora nodorum]KAH5687561.1 hypothetical protein HBI23_035480 [Parastagonospora nodorum]KAH6278445.1 hypothetical protein HBI41_043020 [Parastagonospora nodorum]KAH6303529.1 hypothetical protein HBI40_017320 [Parastagonospora nodorum]
MLTETSSYVAANNPIDSAVHRPSRSLDPTHQPIAIPVPDLPSVDRDVSPRVARPITSSRSQSLPEVLTRHLIQADYCLPIKSKQFRLASIVLSSFPRNL